MKLILGSPDARHMVALVEQGELIVFNEWVLSRGEQTDLAAQVHRCVERNAGAWNTIDGIVCVSGPGSFSFSRTGVAIANAFAFAHALPSMGIDLLQLQVLHARITGVDVGEQVIASAPTIHDSVFIGTGIVGGMGVPDLVYERVSHESFQAHLDFGLRDVFVDVFDRQVWERLASCMDDLKPASDNVILPRYILEPTIGTR